MRALIIGLKLSALVLVAVTVFAGRADAQGSAVSLDVACDQASILGARDTVVHCRFTIRNGGPTPIRDAQLAFQPSNAGSLPDAYFFFREWIDDAEQPSPGVATIFDAGDIAPATQRVLRFDVIVRSAQSFTVDAAVLGAPNQREFARATTVTSVDRSFSPQPARSAELLIVPKAIGEPTDTVQYRLRISNESDQELRNVVVEIEGATGALLTSRDFLAPPERHGPNEPLMTRLPNVAPQRFVETLLTFEAPEPCSYVSPAAVVLADAVGGGPQGVTLAAVAVEGYSLNCVGEGGGEYGLPVSGSGPAEVPSHVSVWPVILLSFGAVLAAAGAVVRRRPHHARWHPRHRSR
jgi:hypothetical protein